MRTTFCRDFDNFLTVGENKSTTVGTSTINIYRYNRGSKISVHENGVHLFVEYKDACFLENVGVSCVFWVARRDGWNAILRIFCREQILPNKL